MEDEGFVDDEFIEETAWEYIGRYGFNCLSVLRERAELAAASGDFVLAQTWSEIVARAAGILQLELRGYADDRTGRHRAVPR